MVATVFWIGLLLTSQAGSGQNPVLQSLLDRGVEANGVHVALPAPSLLDGQDEEAGRAALKSVAGDDRSVENFVRDSVTAPFVLKTRDVRAGDAIIRAADLWFVVRGQLDDLDLKEFLGRNEESAVEAGNMRFAHKILTEKELGPRAPDRLPAEPGRSEWYSHATGRLLDRISVEATDRVVATRTADSLTIAAMTSGAFDADPAFPNRWSAIARSGTAEISSPPRVYEGGGSYAKITRLKAVEEALLVEAHFAFVEPQPWFAGNPILRSKFSVICQDQVRQLRREIQKRRVKK